MIRHARTVALQILGDPIAQPRPQVTTVGGFARAYVPGKHPVHAYKEAVIEAWQDSNGEMFEGPIRVFLTFEFERVRSEYRKTKPNPRGWHAKRPDIDNLQKAVLDALNGHAWHDDGQVCHLEAIKIIAPGLNEPSVCVFISPAAEFSLVSHLFEGMTRDDNNPQWFGSR